MKRLNARTRRNVRIGIAIAERIVILAMAISFITLSVDFFKFPEDYLTTWNYQYKNSIKSGDNESICHYYKNYIEKDRMLWYDDLDMRLMADYMHMTDKDFYDMYDKIREVKGNKYSYEDFLKYLMESK